MGVLDDTMIFSTIIQQGGFSHAAKELGLSPGLISRRIANLEKKLGVSLIKRTTRQIHLTKEGELFWQHAQKIQQELQAALSIIQTSTEKPKGTIRASAPPYFGRHYLTPILISFLQHFPDIKIELILSDQKLDLIKDKLDLTIRGAGYLEEENLKDSSLQMKLLLKEKINLYASPQYLTKMGEPNTFDELTTHNIIHYQTEKQCLETVKWQIAPKNKIKLNSFFNCNDIESALIACTSGYGIGKFTELNVQTALQQQKLRKLFKNINLGHYYLYAIYPQQHHLPKRTRLLLDFINSQTQHLLNKKI